MADTMTDAGNNTIEFTRFTPPNGARAKELFSVGEQEARIAKRLLLAGMRFTVEDLPHVGCTSYACGNDEENCGIAIVGTSATPEEHLQARNEMIREAAQAYDDAREPEESPEEEPPAL